MPGTDTAKAEFDYIIVGGGTAGCVLARRLCEDPDRSVLLLERGPRYPRYRLAIPLFSKRFSQRYLEPVRTVPQHHCAGRRIAFPVAEVLGGGSSINSMIYLRGEASAWDRWAELGCAGWSYPDVLPYFLRMEDITRGGSLGITETRFRSEFGAAFVEACGQTGLAAGPGERNGTRAQAGFYQFTQANGRRSSTAHDYLEPVAGRPNLSIWTGASAHQLVLEGHRAVAVTGVRSGSPFVARARREIVLAAGALGTPQILLLSGLGPAEELSGLGIPVHRDLAGVGRGLQDHPRTTVLFRTTRSVSLSAVALAKGLVQWTLTRHGLLTSPAVAAGAFLQVAEWSRSLDCQLLASWRGTPHDTGLVNIQPVLMEVESRGTVRLSSADPHAPLLVDPAYLSSPRDAQILLQGIRIARALGQAQALHRFGLVDEVRPGPAVSSEPDLRRYLAQSVETAFHPAGTCRMGIDLDSVVDPELRVHGVEGLRIADASVMPVLINANTNGPTLMIAEKAADIIRGRSLAPEAVADAAPAEAYVEASAFPSGWR